MKKNVHPAYQNVLFVDSASGYRFICGSTLQTDARETFEGVEYPVSYLSISSSSHPFFTGSKQLVDSEGRVEKFKKRFERHKEAAKDESEKEGQPQEQEGQPQGKQAAPKAAVKKAPAKK
ncbi:MAG: type B 50S ribosomal protein L31 [Parachlamydia sp.]|jgi:large subunit ribosomal protein L31|nr:type B 50S ribosomal protein L31 [Parachlamydia sp.]